MQYSLVGKVLSRDRYFTRFIFHAVSHELTEDKAQPLTVRHDINIKIFSMERDVPFLQFLTVLTAISAKVRFSETGLMI